MKLTQPSTRRPAIGLFLWCFHSDTLQCARICEASLHVRRQRSLHTLPSFWLMPLIQISVSGQHLRMHAQVSCMSCICGTLIGQLQHLNCLGTSGDAVNGRKLRQLDGRLAPRKCCGDGVVDHAQCIMNQGQRLHVQALAIVLRTYESLLAM